MVDYVLPYRLRAPCIGCGYCCWESQCLWSLLEHGQIVGICPSLMWDVEQQRHYCKLVCAYGSDGRVGKYLGVGLGCNSILNSWRHEELQDRTKYEERQNDKT